MLKDFDLPGTDAPTEESEKTHEFKLAGQRFICNGEVPAGLLLDLASSGASKLPATTNDEEAVEAGGGTIQAFLGFFHGALKPESYERFEQVIRDPKIVVPMAVLSEIASWLAEVYSERPTGESSTSTPGNRSSGGGSTEASLPQVVTYERSPQGAPAMSSSGG